MSYENPTGKTGRGPRGLPGEGIRAIVVTDVDDPSPELSSMAGAFGGDLVLAVEIVSGADNKSSFYGWDPVPSQLPQQIPASVDGDGGRWIAVAGEAANLSTVSLIQSLAHGDILFRGPSKVNALPPGDDGHVLHTRGPAQDPVWAAPVFGQAHVDDTDSSTRQTEDPNTVAHSFQVTAPVDGRYRLACYFEWSLDSTSEFFEAEVCTDDDALCALQMRVEPKDKASRHVAVCFESFDLVAGDYTWELRYGPSDDEEATIYSSNFEFWRVS